MPPTSVMDDFKIKVGKVIGESSKYQKKKKNVYETSEVPCIFLQMSMSTVLEIYKVTLDYLIIIIKTWRRNFENLNFEDTNMNKIRLVFFNFLLDIIFNF